jgi:hypothetical protein
MLLTSFGSLAFASMAIVMAHIVFWLSLLSPESHQDNIWIKSWPPCSKFLPVHLSHTDPPFWRYVKAISHIPCHALAVPLPCRAAEGLDFAFPIWFTQCGCVWFTYAMPRLCRSESDFSRPRHSAAWAWHGMCELASAVWRRHVGDLPAFGFFRLPRGVPRRLLSEAYQSVKL